MLTSSTEDENAVDSAVMVHAADNSDFQDDPCLTWLSTVQKMPFNIDKLTHDKHKIALCISILSLQIDNFSQTFSHKLLFVTHRALAALEVEITV